jgi:hypothetical protein
VEVERATLKASLVELMRLVLADSTDAVSVGISAKMEDIVDASAEVCDYDEDCTKTATLFDTLSEQLRLNGSPRDPGDVLDAALLIREHPESFCAETVMAAAGGYGPALGFVAGDNAIASCPVDCTEDVTVKFRAAPVCISSADIVMEPDSSFVRGAWYREPHQYLVVDLKGTKYGYCNVSPEKAAKFANAKSAGKFYSEQLKGKKEHDCRTMPSPMYSVSGDIADLEERARELEEQVEEARGDVSRAASDLESVNYDLDSSEIQDVIDQLRSVESDLYLPY